MQDRRPLKVFFYVQHLLGIGHLARASRVAHALSQGGHAVTIVTGGTPVNGFPGSGIEHVALPPVVSGVGFSGLADMDGNPVDARFQEDRKARLLAAFHATAPDVVIIEAFPFGRRQVRFELMPLLDAIAATEPKPLLLSSLRDILQERAKPGRDEETVALVKQHFDRVLVHGDPAFARLEDTFPLAGEIADKVLYTGLVAPPPPAPAAEKFEVIVSAGGGAVGNALIRAALAASKTLTTNGPWALVTGPNLPQQDFDAIATDAPEHVKVFRFRPDFASLLGGARLSVSQAGYNTVCDILRAGCRALLVPFIAGGETEQTVRAERLEKLGLASVLTETDLSDATMTEAIRTALAMRQSAHALDLDGARQTARIIEELAAARRLA
ncbi:MULTISPECIES: glycosyltransferase [unclassified Rhizobium]|uniref:glycosyltransferase family protein n=1 Tax=unclassified Rhizobium TaxID=2613769 RepID=UPI0006F30B59|nr:MULTISPECIES: glycosyltransferase [unclassified Rhizobium]KQV38528.1 glycosyl transferase [Rhizobium sp. Root1212]KRD31182.1 glycosyl transferase [Rhizobium sp. Root268]